MSGNHPSAHILRATRCRDSLARSPLASAATRDGAATRRRGTMRTRADGSEGTIEPETTEGGVRATTEKDTAAATDQEQSTARVVSFYTATDGPGRRKRPRPFFHEDGTSVTGKEYADAKRYFASSRNRLVREFQDLAKSYPTSDAFLYFGRPDKTASATRSRVNKLYTSGEIWKLPLSNEDEARTLRDELTETVAKLLGKTMTALNTGDAHARPPTVNVLDEMLEGVMGIARNVVDQIVDDLEPRLAHLLVDSTAAKMTLTRPSAAMKRKMTTPSRIERGESAPVTLHTSDIYAEAPSSHFVRHFGDC